MNQLNDSLKLKKNNYTTVIISELTGIDWDTMYFFHEDSGRPTDESISKIIGVDFHGSGFISNSTRLILLKDKRIAAVIDFNYGKSDGIRLLGGWDNSLEPNNYQKFLKKEGDKFVYFSSCKYEHKYFGLVSQKHFDPKTYLQKDLYKPCY